MPCLSRIDVNKDANNISTGNEWRETVRQHTFWPWTFERRMESVFLRIPIPMFYLVFNTNSDSNTFWNKAFDADSNSYSPRFARIIPIPIPIPIWQPCLKYANCGAYCRWNKFCHKSAAGPQATPKMATPFKRTQDGSTVVMVTHLA